MSDEYKYFIIEAKELQADLTRDLLLLEKQPKDQDLIKERFEVLSKGTKWVKVLNNEGYEDKILLSKVTGLKEGSFYEAMVKKKWHKSGYGIDVEYEEIQDLTNAAIANIDKALEVKQEEIMQV